MDSKVFALILVAVAAFSLLRIISQWRGMSRKRRGINWDEHFIHQLRKAGVNAFEDHTVDFFFTVPDLKASEEMAALLRADSFTVDFKQNADSTDCSLHAQRRMRLAVPEMQALRARFTEMAGQYGATYDNWAVAPE